MKAFVWFGRLSTRPKVLWGLYAVVLLGVTFGLAALSKHAIDLNSRQWATAHREALEQNVRVALWRLDSRLAPYLATLHDTAAAGRLGFASGNHQDFVIRRFAVTKLPGKSGKSRFEYTGVLASEPALANDNEDLNDKIPVEHLVTVVEQLLPEVDTVADAATRLWPNNSLVQSYSLPESPVAQNASPQRELDNRAIAVQQQVMSLNAYDVDQQPVEIRLSPFWIRNQLVLVRSRSDNARFFEGVWLDWTALEQSLSEDIADLLPDVEFLPIQQDETPDPARALAALPVAIVPQAIIAAGPDWSPTHTALMLCWLGLAAAAIVAGLALGRLIALSERRAAFVSAVTHELRTPLTTFRLYSDLLARDMVSSEQDRKEYLQTLRREADRLSHLVDNVLRYSRLERSSSGPAIQTVQLSEWIERITPRLSERLQSAEMTLEVAQQGDGQWPTDPAAVEQLVFNLIDNAAKYAKDATDRRVHLEATIDSDQVTISVTDHGNGVPENLRATIFKPFAKSAERAAETAAGVGLGLALARQTAAALGGSLTYEQSNQRGACFRVKLPA